MALKTTDADATTDAQPTTQRARRRASRAAGPAKAETTGATGETGETRLPLEVSEDPAETEASSEPKKKPAKAVKSLSPVKPPPRRRAPGVRVAWISLAAVLVAVAAMATGVYLLVNQHRAAEAEQARDQRFVDIATQTVVNMYSYKQDTIDESVNRFVDGTSGPLRGMLSANNNVENIKALYRQTNATSEAVVNGAALEGVDAVTNNASVLVSVRVTVADIDGVNKPSMPYRLRVIVHEDETGRMTGYDLRYPDGGN